jgi:hypothetical protein
MRFTSVGDWAVLVVLVTAAVAELRAESQPAATAPAEMGTQGQAGPEPQVQAPVERMSGAEVARFGEFEARPIHGFRNTDLGDYMALRERAVLLGSRRLIAHEEVGTLAGRAVGQDFRLNAVQFDLSEGDCVSFVTRALSMALARDWNSYYLLTERLRHKDGVVDYRNRNFFTLGDWLPNNAWLLSDVTPLLGSAEDRPAQSFTHVVRPKVFEERPAAPGSAFTRITFKGSDYRSPNKEVHADTFIPSQRIPDVLRDLRTGDVILVLRPANGGHLGCDHMGLVAVGADGQVNILHSAPPRVRQEPITTFLQRCNWVSGLKFLRLKDNARQLAAQEVAAMASRTVVPQPAEQDRAIVTTRQRRLAASQPTQP